MPDIYPSRATPGAPRPPGGRSAQIDPEVRGTDLPPQPSLNPAGLAELSTRGLRAIAGALDTAAGSAERIYAEQQRADKIIKNEQDRVDADAAVNQYRLGTAQNALDVRNDPTLPAAQHAEQIETRNRKLRDALGKGLTTHQSRLLYERGADAVQTTAAINARAEGRKTQVDGLKAAKVEERRNLQQTVVHGETETLREGARLRIEADIDDYLARGFYTAEEASAARATSRREIAEGEIARDVRDPAKRMAVYDRLNAGGYGPALTSGRQFELARTIQNQNDEEDRKRQAALKEQWKTDQRTALRDMSTRAAEKSTTLDEIRDFSNRWDLTVEQKEHLEKVYTAPAEEAPSNAEVLATVTQRAHRYTPTITESEIWRLYDPKGGTGLNRKDAKELADHVVARRTHLTEYGHTIQMQRYNQGEQELLQGLGIMPNMLNSLTKEQEKIVSLALRDYSTRAFPTPGQQREDPFAAKNDLLKRYQGVVTPTGLSAPQLRGSLAYPAYDVVPPQAPGADWRNRQGILSATANALEQARKEGRVSGDQYTAERAKWQKLKDTLESDALKYAAPGAPPPAGGTGGGASPSPTRPKNPVGAVPYNPKSNLGSEQ